MCVALSLSACTGKGSGGAAAVNGGADTVDTAAAPASKVPEVRFADTVYASAGRVRHVVTIYDSVSPGRLASTADIYADAPGWLTFRGGPFRDTPQHGTVEGTPSEISVDWCFRTREDYTMTDYGAWGGGTGWTGQHLYVEWPDSCIAAFRREGHVNDHFTGREVIVGSLDGHVYFLDFESGQAVRPAISTGRNPIKGTPSLDPSLNGNLYVGQGVPAERPFGALTIDLHSHRVTQFVDEDSRAWRRWGAYDSSPVRVGQFLFRPGENGILYKYLVRPGELHLHSTLNYSVDGVAPGMEASMSAIGNYGYVADNHGNVLCVNLDSLHPVWHYAIGDDVDASPVLALEDDVPYLYVCCEVDRRGSGPARMVKLDARDGREEWVNERPARRVEVETKHFDGGYYSTPLLGRGNCSHLLFAHCVLNDDDRRNGLFVALDRRDGSVAYERKLQTYAWSSPVSVESSDGRMFVVTADCFGNVYVLDGLSGEERCRKRVGHNFESTPVVVGNSIVVGSRGNGIYKLTLK